MQAASLTDTAFGQDAHVVKYEPPNEEAEQYLVPSVHSGYMDDMGEDHCLEQVLEGDAYDLQKVHERFPHSHTSVQAEREESNLSGLLSCDGEVSHEYILN